jgi:hypothetical protein
MMNDKTKQALNEFLVDSTYSIQDKQELSLWLDGCIIAEPSEEINNSKRFD